MRDFFPEDSCVSDVFLGTILFRNVYHAYNHTRYWAAISTNFLLVTHGIAHDAMPRGSFTKRPAQPLVCDMHTRGYEERHTDLPEFSTNDIISRCGAWSKLRQVDCTIVPTLRLESAPRSCGTHPPPLPTYRKGGFRDFSTKIQICGTEIRTFSTKIHINEFLYR